MSFAGKTAVVTGASSGIGQALAIALAAQGARVGVTARRADRLATLVDGVRIAGGTIESAVADVADRPALLAAVRELAAKLGPVDLLIANAGISDRTGAETMNVPGVERMTRVNFLGVVYSFESVMADMLARKSGHLVAIASMAAYKGMPGAAGYCATKAAVRAYCESLRIELNGSGVAVTCVCPGFVTSEMTASNEYPMPFLMGADRAARRMLRALERRPAVYDFPRRMRALMWLSKWAPDRFIKRRVPIAVAVSPDQEMGRG
jgi:short-subunit dehydrogenase